MYWKKIYSLLPNISLVIDDFVKFIIFIFSCSVAVILNFGGIFVGFADKECGVLAVEFNCGFRVSDAGMEKKKLGRIKFLP